MSTRITLTMPADTEAWADDTLRACGAEVERTEIEVIARYVVPGDRAPMRALYRTPRKCK